ncbi:MAG TPA: hypothetical protein VGO40_13025 [Longimicrobium sp.]|jgi:hypothetical protein|nr:hypothetical protein [Longimicrobium sp.]
MRSLAAVLLLLASACATGGKPEEPPSIVGSYVLTRIDNRALPTYSPTEPNVRVERGSLVLGRAGAFALTLTARSSPQFPPEERSIRGAYEVTGDTLTVTPADARGAPVVYRVARAGVQLTLRDAQGHRYEFVIR